MTKYTNTDTRWQTHSYTAKCAMVFEGAHKALYVVHNLMPFIMIMHARSIARQCRYRRLSSIPRIWTSIGITNDVRCSCQGKRYFAISIHLQSNCHEARSEWMHDDGKLAVSAETKQQKKERGMDWTIQSGGEHLCGPSISFYGIISAGEMTSNRV